MRPLTSISIIVAIALAAPAAIVRITEAQTVSPPCAPYATLAATLADRFGERPIAWAVTNYGQLLKVYASHDSGTWTLVQVAPSGRGCIIAAGSGGWNETPSLNERGA